MIHTVETCSDAVIAIRDRIATDSRQLSLDRDYIIKVILNTTFTCDGGAFFWGLRSLGLR